MTRSNFSHCNPFRMMAGALIIAVLLVAGHATAQTIHVPGDYPTIQEAIDASSNGYEIVVAPGTYHEAINLLGKAISLHSSDGAEVTTIDAFGLETSVVTCASGETDATVIDGFTVTGGMGTFDDSSGHILGGGMLIRSSNPIIRNCRIQHNWADYGGGVFWGFAQGAVLMEDCLFESNLALEDGGGLRLINRVDGDVTAYNLNRCNFRDNVAGGGGGVAVEVPYCGRIAIRQCNFERNTATGSNLIHHPGGGGLFFDLSYLPRDESHVIEDCAFVDNLSAVSGGGALFVDGSAVELVGCLFDSNSAVEFGGGASDDSNDQISFTRCEFRRNLAGMDGGGLWKDRGGTIEECLFLENTAGGDGGGLLDERGVRIVASTFKWNEARRRGGAIYKIRGTGAFDQCHIESNSADQGGGLACSEWGDLVVLRSVVMGNGAADAGGGAFGEVTAIASHFHENNARFGGAVYSTAVSSLRDCVLDANYSRDLGSAVYGPVQLSASTLVRNWTQTEGTIYLETADPDSYIHGCIFAENYAEEPIKTGDGSLIHVEVSLVTGGYPGWGNIDGDPLFVDSANGDYRLNDGSPCVDAALEGLSTDFDDNPRWVGTFADIGAFENQNASRILTLRRPNSGAADEVNTFYVGGTTPGSIAYFVYGLRTGSTNVPGCSGTTLDIANPNLFGQVVTEEHGFGSVDVNIPGAASGHGVFFQAVDLDACEVSNRVEHMFE